MKSPRSGCSGSRPDDCCRPAGSESGANAGSDFVVIPAIDLKEGCCVRLRQGVASDKTVYSGDPVEVAMEWELQGAALLHVVDLDGAFLGQPVHTKLIGRLAQAVCIPVQAGGGLRTEDHIRELFDLGVWRAIVGTSACVAQEETASLLGAFADKLAVAIDARGGVVRVKGWTETASLDFLDVAGRAARMGAKTIIYTDIAADGMLGGPDAEGVAALCEAVDCDVIASGGIASAEHILKLKRLNAHNLVGAIVGKALYEGKVTLRELTG